MSWEVKREGITAVKHFSHLAARSYSTRSLELIFLTANPKLGAAKPKRALPSWLSPEEALAGLPWTTAHTDAEVLT